ncbi:hypothetical protein BH10PSE14_BH10PSE14_36860 [soil metagenome]
MIPLRSTPSMYVLYMFIFRLSIGNRAAPWAGHGGDLRPDRVDGLGRSGIAAVERTDAVHQFLERDG